MFSWLLVKLYCHGANRILLKHVVPFQFPLETLIPDGKRITWDSRKGFIISNATYREIGLLICETTVNGHLYKTNYLTHRQSKWCSNDMNKSQNAQGSICLMKPWLKIIIIMSLLPLAANTIIDVYISTPSPIKLLRGQSLTLNCTAITPLNTRVQMTWSYPGEVSDPFFYFSPVFCKTLYFQHVQRHWVFDVGKIRIFWLMRQLASLYSRFGCFPCPMFQERDVHR